jgi:DNA-binding NarL/FixJ family response regulator
LTQREQEVLSLLGSGVDTRRIAEHLLISRNTARNYVQNVLVKLGAHSQIEAVAIGRREGLLPDG